MKKGCEQCSQPSDRRQTRFRLRPKAGLLRRC
ncbi:MAG: hypothetical protein IKI69_06595 [Oscillospiraceae bacterium]|nr:hypothetical protein [Oscillospiraceae bacterium]